MSEAYAAVWFVDAQGDVDCALVDDEAEAASLACGYHEDWDFHLLGIQFADGSLLQRKQVEEWPAFRSEKERRSAAKLEWAATHVPRPTRRILDPFAGNQIVVDADEPAWLGMPA